MKKISEYLLSLLHIRAVAAGLELSDQVIRLMYFDGKKWQMHAIRLEPGILDGGKIKDRDGFIAALRALKAKAYPRKKAGMVSVAVCLGSAPIYTQMFTLPETKGEHIQEAIALNLKMVSPVEEGKGYSGWQLVGRDAITSQEEVLAAFMERQMVDEVSDALFEAGFLAISLESRALALARVLREKGAGIESDKAYILVSIDDSGMDFLIIRKGALHFEYAEPWRDIMDEKGEILVEKFKTALAAGTRQVVNFYKQHWPEPLGGIILSATALAAQAEEAIAGAVSVSALELSLVMGQTISSEWLAVLGASLRGKNVKAKKEINLLGETSKNRFHGEQLLNFLRFWRVVIPLVFALLIVTFLLADVFLMDTRGTIESSSGFNFSGTDTSEVNALTTAAGSFNQTVALVSAAEHATQPKSPLMEKVEGFADASQVTINHMSFQSAGTPVTLSGTAQAQDHIVAFKTALSSDPSFQSVQLPLTQIQTNGGSVSFSMTFVYSPVGNLFANP